MMRLIFWALACALFGFSGLVILAGVDLFDAAESTGRGIDGSPRPGFLRFI